MDSNDDLIYLTFVARIGLIILGATLLYKLYRYWMNGTRYTKDAETSDKVAIITGASSVIGKGVAYGLAKRGLTVILACHNEENGLNVQNDIVEKTGNSNVKYMHLNLASFKSIRQFADEFLSTGSRLDILINNANVMHLKRELTKDNIEHNIGINYLGHFLLSMLLIKRMSKTTPSRVINISNWLHRYIEIDQTDLMYEQQFCGFLAYTRSQLANVFFTLALAKRLENTGITCNCVHPGISLANVVEHLHIYSRWIPKRLAMSIAKFFSRSDDACADTLIFAAIDFSLQNISGVYLSNTEIGELGSNSNNDEAMEWLWKRSEEITGETLPDLPNNFKFLNNNSF